MPGWTSRYFSPSEFLSRGRPLLGDTPIQYAALALELDKIRDHVGRPIIINDGQRYPDHNAYVGGEPSSYHLPPADRPHGNVRGVAADFHVIGFTPEEHHQLFLWMRAQRDAGALHFGGAEFYPRANFIHIDSRPDRAEWPAQSGRAEWERAHP